MRERKLIIRAISAVVTLLMAQFSPLLAQDSKPRGIIVHDPSNLGAKFAQAEVFSNVTQFAVATNVISPDGKKTQILNNRIKALVSFPANGSSPREYETVADELKQIAPKYPLASSLLSENERILRKRAEELREQHRENMAYIAQELQQEAQRKKRIEALRQHRNNQIGRIITFKDNEGKLYENVKLEVIEPDGITIRSGAEKKKILFTAVSEEVREFLGYDPNIAADYIRTVKEKEDKARRMAQAEAERKEREKMAEEQAELKKARIELQKQLKAQALSQFGRFLERAKRGDAAAQFWVAFAYYDGQTSVERDGVDHTVNTVLKDEGAYLAWLYCASFNGFPQAIELINQMEIYLKLRGGVKLAEAERAREKGRMMFEQHGK